MKARSGTAALCLAVVLAPMAAAGCAVATAPSSGGRLVVVAAENTWGSIAAQLGGNQVTVTSIVSDPNADPHEYESSPADARLFASANFVIVNGAGYDSWADHLLAAQPESGRRVLNVAGLLGKRSGDNPHFWYDPAYVSRVVDQVYAAYRALAPSRSAYFTARYNAFEQLLAPYRNRLAYIQQHFAGTPIASTESIFVYLADYTHLNLITPAAFMDAVAEGNDPPASAVVTFTSQIRARAFDVFVFNVQTVTPLTTGLREQAAAQNIPVIGVSETIQPPIATFEEWMDGQLDSLINGLNAKALSG